MGAADVNLHAFLPPGTTGTLSDADELDRYAANVAAFLAGAIPDDRFTAMRLQQGCYGQRQPGVHMVRCKAPGGRLDPAQLIALTRQSCLGTLGVVYTSLEQDDIDALVRELP